MSLAFAIANQKGGVGKTTTAVNLAAACAEIGQRVLLVDMDPQGNATANSGLRKNQLKQHLYHGLIGTAALAELVVKPQNAGYDLLATNRDLAGAEVELVDLPQRESRLKLLLQDAPYDLILVDCPPSLSLLTVNALVAVRGVIVPMQCEYFALEGLSDLVNTIKQVRTHFHPDLYLAGLLRVMFDPRMTLQQQVAQQLKEHFGSRVFDTVIPRNVRLAEAPSYGLPGVVFDAQAKGSQAYFEFAKEFMARFLSPSPNDHQTVSHPDEHATSALKQEAA